MLKSIRLHTALLHHIFIHINRITPTCTSPGPFFHRILNPDKISHSKIFLSSVFLIMKIQFFLFLYCIYAYSCLRNRSPPNAIFSNSLQTPKLNPDESVKGACPESNTCDRSTHSNHTLTHTHTYTHTTAIQNMLASYLLSTLLFLAPTAISSTQFHVKLNNHHQSALLKSNNYTNNNNNNNNNNNKTSRRYAEELIRGEKIAPGALQFDPSLYVKGRGTEDIPHAVDHSDDLGDNSQQNDVNTDEDNNNAQQHQQHQPQIPPITTPQAGKYIPIPYMPIISFINRKQILSIFWTNNEGKIVARMWKICLNLT